MLRMAAGVLLWAAVDLLQVLGQGGCGRDNWSNREQAPLLQQVDHPQGLGGVALEAQRAQGGAHLGHAQPTRWLQHTQDKYMSCCKCGMDIKESKLIYSWCADRRRPHMMQSRASHAFHMAICRVLSTSQCIVAKRRL